MLPLPISALQVGRPVLGNPANRSRAVPLTYEQFRYAFANAVSEDEAKELYEHLRGPGRRARRCSRRRRRTSTRGPRPRSTRKNPERGPLLIISGEKDHTVPWAIANASYKKQKRNEGVTEIVEIPGRGHALTIDSGWREVADTALGVRQAVRGVATGSASTGSATSGPNVGKRQVPSAPARAPRCPQRLRGS